MGIGVQKGLSGGGCVDFFATKRANKVTGTAADSTWTIDNCTLQHHIAYPLTFWFHFHQASILQSERDMPTNHTGTHAISSGNNSCIICAISWSKKQFEFRETNWCPSKKRLKPWNPLKVKWKPLRERLNNKLPPPTIDLVKLQISTNVSRSAIRVTVNFCSRLTNETFVTIRQTNKHFEPFEAQKAGGVSANSKQHQPNNNKSTQRYNHRYDQIEK